MKQQRVAVAVALGALIAPLGLTAVRAEPSEAPAAWPPPLAAQSHALFDFVHYGENHHNEDGGPLVNGEIFRQTNLYGAAFLANSSDLATVGTELELGSFKRYITEGISPICPDLEPCQSALEVPWYHSIGNHDREPIAGPGGVFSYDNGVYRSLFADRPYPWGDDPDTLPAGFTVPDVNDLANRKPGAATHYAVDHGPLRLIVVDNSTHSLSIGDLLSAQEEACAGGPPCPTVGQNPPVGPGFKHLSQFDFLTVAAQDAKAQGMLVFAMMHEPTSDPRYPGNVAAISVNHTMNKGATADNLAFEALAAALGVDGVLLGHIKGNNVYERGGVPYHINGGGGGNPFAADSGGIYSVDFGTYYAYRIYRIGDGAILGSYLIPIVDRFELSLDGEGLEEPSAGAGVGETLAFAATAVQPACTDPANSSIGFHGCSGRIIEVELREPAPPPGFQGSVPSPAFVWHTSDPTVLAPASGSAASDPDFDALSMSRDGRFVAVGTGTATVTIVTGWSRTEITVTVE